MGNLLKEKLRLRNAWPGKLYEEIRIIGLSGTGFSPPEYLEAAYGSPAERNYSLEAGSMSQKMCPVVTLSMLPV